MEIVQRKKNNSLKFLFLLIILAGLGLSLLLPTLEIKIPHSQERPIAAEIDSFCKQSPDKKLFFNQETNRTAEVVCLDNGKFAIKICEHENGNVCRHITSFVKDKMTKFSQVKKYLANQGYFPWNQY